MLIYFITFARVNMFLRLNTKRWMSKIELAINFSASKTSTLRFSWYAHWNGKGVGKGFELNLCNELKQKVLFQNDTILQKSKTHTLA